MHYFWEVIVPGHHKALKVVTVNIYLEIAIHITFCIIAIRFLYKKKDMFFSEQSPKLLLYSMLFALVFFGIVFLCSFPVLGNGIEETFWATLRI
jgi:hypothetical protein